MKFHILIFLFMIVFASQNALACTQPDGVAGDVLFNADHAVLQFCNGTSWIGMGGGGGGAQIWSQDGDDVHYNDGNVGIGTDSPAVTLDIDGDVNITGTITLGTQGTESSHAVRADRTITAGTGLTGGGNLTANRTLNFDTSWGDGRYVNRSGDTITGSLTVSGNVSGNRIYTNDVSGGRWCRADSDGRIRCNQAEPSGGGGGASCQQSFWSPVYAHGQVYVVSSCSSAGQANDLYQCFNGAVQYLGSFGCSSPW